MSQEEKGAIYYTTNESINSLGSNESNVKAPLLESDEKVKARKELCLEVTSFFLPLVGLILALYYSCKRNEKLAELCIDRACKGVEMLFIIVLVAAAIFYTSF